MRVQVLRTPDDRFADLEGFDFEPHYRDVHADDGTVLRLHFVDEGPATAPPVLLLHGNPTWSYLHRHMIGGLVESGHRVLSLDLMGMGRSDKPDDPDYYTVDRHLDWMTQWFEGEDLRQATVFCQDWGGVLALMLLPVVGERVDRFIASNTGLPAGEGLNPFMEQWLAFNRSADVLPVGGIVQSGTSRRLAPEELAAYEAPFPDGQHQAGAKRFPFLIPLQPDNPATPRARAVWRFLATWEKPFLTVFGSEDPVAYKPGSHRKLQRVIPGAVGQPHEVIDGAAHFIQEDAAGRLVEIIDRFARA